MDTTTNYAMNLPGGGDTADQTKFNENTAKIDTALGSLGSGLAIIANRNSHAAIAAGDYVYIRNHTTLSEGLYKARTAIDANATLSTSNVATADGSLNSISGQISTLSGKVASMVPTGTNYDDRATFTMNFANNERHLIVVVAANATTRTLAIVVSTSSSGSVNVAELYKGSTVTYDASVNNKITVTQNTETRSIIADFVLNGDFLTVS